ncbi:MAG: glycosyltransferase family 39 protein [Candidatus Aenigmarchaeota archaeon]|nr:glycosyltransferase family 39 protein [Candidatus Aenigmarchaeota archaeon]
MVFDFQSFLSSNLFYILLVNFVLICILLILNIRDIASLFKKIKIHVWIAFILIFVFGSYLRFASPGCGAHDGLCWDYVKTSVNMLEGQPVEDFWHPKGYSLLMTIGFFFFDSAYNTILYLNLVFSSLTIFIVFLLAYILFKREDVALFSSLIYSLFPMPILYAKSNVSELTSVFFITLTVLVYLISLRLEKRSLYLLSFLLLVFSLHMRTDNSIFVPLFIIGFILNRNKFQIKKLMIPLVIFLVFMIPVSYYYIIGDDTYGPSRDPHYEERPTTFSLGYLIPNIQHHLSANLAEPGVYPTILYVFLLFSLLFVLKERNIIFPVSWIILFFLFYGLYWATLYTSPQLYQLTLQPALAILMGYGIFKAKNLGERVIENMSSLKIPYVVKSAGVFVILLLILFLFHSSTNVFALEKQDCLIEHIIYFGGYVGDDDCLLIENSHSNYCMCSPIMVMKILLPDKYINMSLPGCENRDGVYYLYINHKMCDTTFFGYERLIFGQLEKEHTLEIVEERGCVSLYKIGG